MMSRLCLLYSLAFPSFAAAAGKEQPVTIPVVQNTCDQSENYLQLVTNRIKRWEPWKNKESVYLHRNNLWQASLDTKLIGYFFANSLGVRTPTVHACEPGGALFLPQIFPASWGGKFVVKPIMGFNSEGVLLVDKGKDRFSGRKVAGQRDVLHTYSSTLSKSTVERIIRTTVRPLPPILLFTYLVLKIPIPT